MEGSFCCVVLYGNDFLCSFKQIPDPLKEFVLNIINFNYKALDITKLLSDVDDVLTEIQLLGQSFLTLAEALREKNILGGESDKRPLESLQANTNCVQQYATKANNISDGFCGEGGDSNECDVSDQLKVTLKVEQEKNDELQSTVNELRLLQRQRFARLEEQFKQGYKVTLYYRWILDKPQS